MGTKHDLTWIQTQLTLTRWYLDAAASAAAGAVRHHLQQAQNVYDVTVCSLSQFHLDEGQRASIEQALSDLQARLERAEKQM